MKRLPGVIVSGVILILLCLFQLLLAAGLAGSTAWMESRMHSGQLPGAAVGAASLLPAWVPLVVYAESAFFAALGAWGILTAVGLFRTRRWARISMLVIGGGLAFFGLCMLLATVLMMAMSKTLAAGVAPQGHSAFAILLASTAAIDAAVLGLGVFWLVYFNLRRVRAVFAGEAETSGPGKRPMLIAVLAVFFLIGAACCLLMTFLPLPAAFFGLTLHGGSKAAVYLVYAALLAASGVGLWRLAEWGRRLALLGQVLGIAQNVVYFVRPSLMVGYSAEINQKMHLPPPTTLQAVQGSLARTTFGISILFILAIVIVLHVYRKAFAQTAEAEPSAISDL